MNIKTTTDNSGDKRERLKLMREHQQPLLDAIGESNAFYVPKMAYKPTGKNDIHVSFFPSEVNRQCDIFLEFSGRDYIPEDPLRRLFKWRFNPHFDEEYEKTEANESGQFRYLVPVSELVLVQDPRSVTKEKVKVEETPTIEFDLMDPESDAPFDQLTIRDLTAILLKKPVSNKQWLNKLITDK